MSLLPGLEGYAKRDAALGQWDTHPSVARVFARWCSPTTEDRVLEPSAGIGNMVAALVERGASVSAFEIDPERAELLRERGAGVVEVCDFLSREPTFAFDLVAMNPPYEDDAEAKHIAQALRFAPRVCAIVRLVALASASRADFWASVEVTRVAILVPRPVFAGSSGMDEIMFIEVRRGPWRSKPTLEWLNWKDVTR